jgi:hypothetical protein
VTSDRVLGLIYVTLALFIVLACVGGAIYYAVRFG